MLRPTSHQKQERQTCADLSDLIRDSSEHRQIADLEREGIAHLAQGNLAAARQNLVQAMAAADRVHSYHSHRRIQNWLARVFLKAGHIHEALGAFAAAGASKEAVETAKASRKRLPAITEGTAPPFDLLLEIASVGDVASCGAALAALAQLWDVLPNDNLPALADYLSGLDSFRSSFFADRSILSDATDLVFNLAPRLREGQAQNVGNAVIATIQRRDVFWTAHKSACLALARLAKTHPEVLGDLDLPTTRLAEMASQDILNDTKMAMTALINLALAGSEEARNEAQSLLGDADTLTRVTWRHVLNDVTEEELASTIRDLLPRTINRVHTVEGGFSFGISALSPMFLRDWTLPESVKEEVANTLTQAVTDPDVPLPDRQSAAVILGLKAEQFREEERHQAVNALLDVLTRPFEAHDIVRSIDDPLSMVRMNIGQVQDVIAAAAGALLRFFELIDDLQQRQRVIEEVGKLRASQVESIGRSIAAGLRHLATRDEDEERWLRTRLLLLLDSHHPAVRQDAARSLL